MADDYLMMARVLDEKLVDWEKENLRLDDIGMTIAKARQAYRDGFIKGFMLKLTKGEE